LRDNQLETVYNYIDQQKNTLVLIKTGDKKSLYFLLSAVLFDDLTIIIILLIALMQEQV
ncbi:16239_t:CDS:1, partial [Racocetra persica]